MLRKTKINELPQLINVLKGDMSVIGPRPVTPDQFDYYPDDVKQVIGRVRPGLSGVGSIMFRNEEAILSACGMAPELFHKQNMAPYKGRLEVWYCENRSFFLDLKLIALTILVVLNPSLDPHKYLPGLPEVPSELSRQGGDDPAAQPLQMPSNA
jgi:lipopolysaccharide/colanic/teichoic acid biosynthesis glycosyltransferase